MRTKYPDRTVFTETIHESSLDVVQDAYSLYPEYYKSKIVPLYSAVYQGYSSLHEWRTFARSLDNLSDFAAAMAIAVHEGHKIGGFTTMTTQEELLKPHHKYVGLDYFKRLVEMKTRTMAVFAYGRRLRDPRVTGSPWHRVIYFHNKPGS